MNRAKPRRSRHACQCAQNQPSPTKWMMFGLNWSRQRRICPGENQTCGAECIGGGRRGQPVNRKISMPSGVRSRSGHSGRGLRGKAYLAVKTPTAATAGDASSCLESCSTARSMPPR